jgi:serine/threonine protein kinase/uncharacterized caspase-like protein
MADLPLDIAELEEKYEIVAKLGEGGMGAVYKVRHKVLGKLRVIKTIRPQLQSDQDLQNRFLREAQVAAGLRHPNIAAVHDCAFTKSGTAYIVMEHIEGQNLRDYQRSGGRLVVDQVVEVGRQALDALGYLHSKNFVHRDISTDNMMISWHDGLPTVTLIDLGLAKSLESSQWQTKTGMVVGKVRYISPEQLNAGVDGVEVDARSDLYSMGVVLYELLTGLFPITGQDDMSMIAGHLYRPPRPFEETDPKAKIPSPLRAVVMRALEKKADFRWPSAREFGQALKESIHHSHTAPLTVPDDEQRTLRLSSPTAGISPPAFAPRDPNQPTVTVDVGRQGRPVPAAAPTLLAVPDLKTLPIDSEGVTAPITSPLPPPPAKAGTPKKAALLGGLLVPLLALLTIFIATKGKKPAEEAAPIVYGQYHALVIGNDNYQKMEKLETAVNDARTLERLLAKRFGFEVTLLLDGDRTQIYDAIEAYDGKLTVRDNLLVFFAGHGKIEGGNTYWLPVDADPLKTTNWISTEAEITRLLETLGARHVLVVADSCYAGANAGVFEENQPAPPEESRHDRLKRLDSRYSRMVLASGGNSPVLDSGGSGHSIFASALFDALEKMKDPLEVSALYRAIKPAVVARSRQLKAPQEPALAPMNSTRDEGGELVFVPKPAASG